MRANVSRTELAMLEQRRDGPAPTKVGRDSTRKEREILDAILSYLRFVPGVVVWRQNTGAVTEGTRFIRFGVAGISDIIGWRSRAGVAQFLAIEVKRPGHHPTVQQQTFLRLVHESGGLALVARSVEDVRRAFA